MIYHKKNNDDINNNTIDKDKKRIYIYIWYIKNDKWDFEYNSFQIYIIYI